MQFYGIGMEFHEIGMELAWNFMELVWNWHGICIEFDLTWVYHWPVLTRSSVILIRLQLNPVLPRTCSIRFGAIPNLHGIGMNWHVISWNWKWNCNGAGMEFHRLGMEFTWTWHGIGMPLAWNWF